MIIGDLKSDSLSSHVCAIMIIHTVKPSMVRKLTVASLKGQSWHILKSWYTGGDPEQEFHCFYPEELDQKFSSIFGTGYITILQTYMAILDTIIIKTAKWNSS